jgi:hypothetical protein
METVKIGTPSISRGTTFTAPPYAHGHPRAVFVEIDGDLTAAVAEADDEDIPPSKTLSVTVLGTVQNVATEALLTRPHRHVRNRVVPCCDNHPTAAIDARARRCQPSTIIGHDALHLLVELRSEIEVACVAFKIGDHLLAGRVAWRAWRKVQVGQGRVTFGRV